MDDLRVPTMVVPAEAELDGGESLAGRVFIPAASARHGGAMRVDEWLNLPEPFFPFVPDGSEGAVLLNKKALVALHVPASEADPEVPEALVAVTVWCGASEWSGDVALQPAVGRSRLLDLMNFPEAFLVVRAGPRDHLVSKRRITRLVERRKA